MISFEDPVPHNKCVNLHFQCFAMSRKVVQCPRYVAQCPCVLRNINIAHQICISNVVPCLGILRNVLGMLRNIRNVMQVQRLMIVWQRNWPDIKFANCPSVIPFMSCETVHSVIEASMELSSHITVYWLFTNPFARQAVH